MDYIIKSFNQKHNTIVIAYDNKEISVILPVVNGLYIVGSELDTYCRTMINQKKSAEETQNNIPNADQIRALVVTPIQTDEEKEKEFYAKRRYFLKGTDWTIGADSPLSPTEKTQWATWRQELRDLPDNPQFPNVPIPTAPNQVVIDDILDRISGK